MTISTRSLIAALALSAAAFTTSAAGAATLTYGSLPGTAEMMPTATATSGTVYENTTGSISGVKASAWLGTSVDPDAATSYYTSVSGGSSADYSLGLANGASFVWGSPDSYNKVEFLLKGVVVDSHQLASAMSNGFMAVFSNIAGGVFDTIRLSSGSNAFEIANLTIAPTAPVPLPAAGLMLIAGLGGLAAVRRRKMA